MSPPLSSHVAFGVEAIVLLRLAGGLWRAYPAFAGMITAGFASHAFARLWPALYRDAWIWSTPILVALQFVTAIEVYRLQARRWRRTGEPLWWGLLVAFALLAVVAVAPRAGVIPIMAEVQRAGAFAIAVGLGVVWWVLGLRGQHSRLVLGVFALLAVAWLPFSLSADFRALSNDVFGYGRAALLLAWCYAIEWPDVQVLAFDRAEAQRQAAIIEKTCRE